MVKKILKWTGIVLLVLIVALVAAPFIFKEKIKSMVVKAINDQVDATVAFEDVNLSLLKNFPQASVTVDKLSVVNKAPFAGDTLVYMGEVNLTMSVKELFKSAGETMDLKSFTLKNSVVNILFNKDGIGNFDIALKNKDEKPSDDKAGKPFALSVDSYAIENLRFKYYDERSKMKVVVDSLNHSGKGNFAANKLDLDTHTTATLTMDMDKANFMNGVKLKLDVVLGMDLDKKIYTFKQNKAYINQMALEFDGSVAMKEAGQQIDLTFKTPESSFKNFLALVPAAYSGSIKDVKTEGDFTINGKVNGFNSNNSVPKFNIVFASNNASFQYPGLPKSIQNIVIDTKIINETGVLNDTYVNLDKLSFRIDQDVFDASANIHNIIEKPLVDAKIKGTINLANFTKAYPVKLDTPLSGILKADVASKFDMASVDKGAYEKIDNRGSISVSGFNYKVDGFAHPFVISQADVQFNPSRISLSKFDAKTGSSDIAITGAIDNFYGFVFKNQNLQGNFNMASDKLVVADFMAAETATTKKTTTTTDGDKKTTETKKTVAKSEAVKIPAFLDCTITAKANTVVYDNLNLKDVSGKMIIKDEAVTLQNVKTSVFGGSIGFNGNVSTKAATPTFKMDLALNSLDITQSFTQLDMLKNIAPIADVITGKLNTTVNVAGNLDAKEMTPDMKSIVGSLAGSLANAVIHTDKSKVLNALTSNVKFLDPAKLNLNQKINLTFDNGRVNIKPFVLKYQDIDVTIGGSHGFDQTMDYNVSFNVPAKYLGNAVVDKAAALKVDISKISVPVTANITGNFQSPKVTTDIAKATAAVVTQLVNQEKDKYINQAKDKGKEILNNLVKKDSTGKTAAPTKDDVKKAADDVKNGIKNIFGKKKKEE